MEKVTPEEEIEDREDLKNLDQLRKEPTVPLEQVIEELGLDLIEFREELENP